MNPVRNRRAARGSRVALPLLALLGYDLWLRPWMLFWGSSAEERSQPLPGDDPTLDPAAHCTKGVTIDASPEQIWPWLVQMGDRRAGFYSYDWVERFVFAGTVHYVDRTHSATRIHPELQHPKLGDRLNTGSVGTRFALGNPISVLEPNRALVWGWAFVLQPQPDGRTRLLLREADTSSLQQIPPRRYVLPRALLGAIDYLVGDPLHFAMERKMLLGIKQRAEAGAAAPEPERVPEPVN